VPRSTASSAFETVPAVETSGRLPNNVYRIREHLTEAEIDKLLGQTRELGGVTITTSSGQKGVWLVGSEQVALCHRVHSGADGAESEGAGSFWFDPQQVRINLSPGSITASYFEADTWLKVLSSLHRPASVLFCPIPCFHP
jgi:hypothetical protein